MDRKWIIKIVGVTAATAVLLVSVCGCSIMKKVYSNIADADKEAAAMPGSVEYVGFDGTAQAVENIAAARQVSGIDVFLPVELSDGDVANREIAQEASAGFANYGSEDDSMQVYEEYGVTYNSVTDNWWFTGKPLAGISDPGYFTLANGNYRDIGAFLKVERDVLGNITNVQEVSQDSLAQDAGVSLQNTLEQDCREERLDFYKEDVSVKDMDAKQFVDLERSFYAKYRHKDAVVQCNDHIFSLGKYDMLKLSSFCGADTNPFGVSVSADYDIADEIDLAKLDSVGVDRLLLDLLKNNAYKNAREVESAAKTAVAQHYGIGEKNLAAAASLI